MIAHVVYANAAITKIPAREKLKQDKEPPPRPLHTGLRKLIFCTSLGHKSISHYSFFPPLFSVFEMEALI